MPFNTQRTSPSPTSRLGGGGLDYITSSTFSAAAAASVDGCFADYLFYRVMITLTSASTSTIQWRYRVGGSDNSTANYGQQIISALDTIISGARATGQTSHRIGNYENTGTLISLDCAYPNATEYSLLTAQSVDGATGASMRLNVGRFAATTQFDGFSVYPSTGTLTGSLTVFGYRKA